MKLLRRFTILTIILLVIFTLTVNHIMVKGYDEQLPTEETFINNLTVYNDSLQITFTDLNKDIHQLNLIKQYFYGILNEENKVRYYIADALLNAKNEDSIIILNAMLYTKDSLVFDSTKEMILSITFYMREFNDVYKIEKTVNYGIYKYIALKSDLISLVDNELSERLNLSVNFYNSYESLKNKDVATNANNESSISPMAIVPIEPTPIYYANQNQTIERYKYDSYTLNDDIIDYYTFGVKYNSDGKIVNDSITNIVPREFFFKTGTFTYIGEQYGFFIKTVLESSYTYACDVMVFDVEVIRPGFTDPQNEATVLVKPLFQYKYYGKQRGRMTLEEWSAKYDPSLYSVVTPHVNYDSTNYYLKDVSFRVTIGNVTQPNPGLSGYSPSTDGGEVCYEGKYSFNGEGKKTGRTSWVLDTIQMAFGAPTVYPSVIKNDLEYSFGELYEPKYSTYSTFDYIPVTDKVATYEIPALDRGEQMLYYNRFMRSVLLTPETNVTNESPLLIGTRTPNNFAKGNVKVTYPANEAVCIEQFMQASICLDVVSDDTYFEVFDWFPHGSVNTVDTVESSYHYDNFEVLKPGYGYTLSTPLSITYPGSSLYIVWNNDYPGKYYIETFGSCDTYMSLFSARDGQLYKYDDDSGEGTNSYIYLDLPTAETFVIVIRLFSSSATGSFNYKSFWVPDSNLEINKSIVIDYKGYCFTYTFTPTITQSYYFKATSGYSISIQVYNSSGRLIYYALECDPRLVCNLTAGNLYYVRLFIIPEYIKTAVGTLLVNPVT